jgi:hypothetical protein
VVVGRSRKAVSRDHAPPRERFDDEERRLIACIAALARRELRECQVRRGWERDPDLHSTTVGHKTAEKRREIRGLAAILVDLAAYLPEQRRTHDAVLRESLAKTPFVKAEARRNGRYLHRVTVASHGHHDGTNESDECFETVRHVTPFGG